MAHRLITVVTVLVLWHPTVVSAQARPVTLRDIVSAMEQARQKGRLQEISPAIDEELTAHLDVLRNSGMLHHTAAELAEAVAAPRLSAIARTRSGLAPPQVVVALYEVKGLRNNEVREALEAATSSAEASQILAPVTAFQLEELSISINNSIRVVRMYERKFGPNSARLNGAETILNYGLQRVRWFGPNDDGEPGPLEAIASYSPTYMSYVDGKAVMVSASEIGLRRYFFGDHWGRRGIKGLMRPAFATLGLAVAGEKDGALQWPWQGDSRLGGFVSWGELKVAYVAGENRRLMVSRQFQIVPWVF